MPSTPQGGTPPRRPKIPAASPLAGRQASSPSRSMKLPPRGRTPQKAGTPRGTPKKMEYDNNNSSGGEGIQGEFMRT